MAYIRPSNTPPPSTQTVEALARLFGLAVPAGDLEEVALALRDQLAAVEQLDKLDLTDASPCFAFDPHWHD
jgi:hypothetical protein